MTKMTKKTEHYTDTFHSDILSDHCGFEVTLTVAGTRTIKTFPNFPVGPTDVEMEKDQFTFVATAGNNTFRWTQASTTVQRIEPDRTVIEQVAGHQPVHFIGVKRTNLKTGEIIFKSSKDSNDSKDLDKICQKLSG
jgi:hypothetical protein